MIRIAFFAALFSIFSLAANGDVKISQLPLGTAASTNVNDSFPYVSTTANATQRLKLSDLINLPQMVATYAPLASPTFTGTVTAPTIVLSTGATVGYCWEATSTGGAGAWQACSSFVNPMTTLGDLMYGGASGVATRLAGNTSTTKEFLTQTGTGSASAAPVWGTIAAGDVPTLNQNTTGSAGSLTQSLTANEPVIGNGTGITVGTKSGNTTDFATVTGSLTSGDCLQADANGNVQTTGSACGSAGGGVTTVGTYNSQTSSSNGAVISGSDIYFQPFTSSNPGMAPASGGGTTNFLRADGTWAAPSGGGGTPGGANTDLQYNSSGSFGGNANATTDGLGNLTLAGKVNATTALLSSLTASEPVVSDASKNLASGSVSAPLTFSAGDFGISLIDSITTSGSSLALSGDAASPGNSQYYGTNGSGTKGWYALPGSPTAPTFTALPSTGTTTGYFFTVSSANATVGATYTNNANTYTVLATISSGTRLFCSGASAPTSSGTLTKATGTGDATITFSAEQALATYTTPTSPSPLYLHIRAVGGGGGGQGDTGGGGSGGITTFGSNLLIMNGGSGGVSSVGGVGGTAVNNGVTVGECQPGNNGGSGAGGAAGAPIIAGGVGGASPFGGSGTGNLSASGGAATGYGSGGGAYGGTSGNGSGGGGGSGASCDVKIATPAANYYYSIGAGGAGGTTGGGFAGGGGFQGVIYIEADYQ